MSTPFFSVIIPTFNRAVFLREAIRSALVQKDTAFEVIVVDDGSTDNTSEVLNEFGDRVRSFRQQNAGPGAARNLAIQHARGKYVAFLDSDDVWFPWTLSTYRRAIDHYGEPTTVMGSAIYWSGDQEPKAAGGAQFNTHHFADYFATANDRFVRTACVLAVRTDALRKIGGFTTRRINGEDYDLLYRLGVEHGFVRIVAPPVVAYRQHTGSSSGNPNASYEARFIIFVKMKRVSIRVGNVAKRNVSPFSFTARRNVCWMLLEARKLRCAWHLYEKSWRANLREGRIRFLVGFPLLACAASVGCYRRRKTQGGQSQVRSTVRQDRHPQCLSAKERLRILLTIHHSLDWNAGAAGSTLHLKRCYEAAGHTVELFSFEDLPTRLPEIARQVVFPCSVAAYLSRRADDFDVVDASTGDAWVWASLLRARRGGPALVTRSTGLEHSAHLAKLESARRGAERLSWKYPIYHGGVHLWEVAQSLRRSDWCMFLNDDDRTYAVDQLGVLRSRTSLVSNGIPNFLLNLPLDLNDHSHGKIRLAHIGSFIERKGIEYSIPALHQLLRKFSQLHVSFVGTGYGADAVLSRFDPDIRSRLRVVPRYDHQELPKLLAGHAIQIFASLNEGFGKTLVESMACGLAPVTTDLPFARRIVTHGSDALVVPFRDTRAIVEAVSRLLSDPELLSKMRMNAYQTAQNYSWSTAAAHRLEGYRRAILARANGRGAD